MSTLFIAIGLVLTLATAALLVTPLLRREPPAPVAATLTALLVPSAVLILYLAVSNHDWNATADTASKAAGNSELAGLVAQLDERLRNAPDDVNGWLLLGRSYVQLQDYSGAVQAFRQALTLTGGANIDAKTGLAEALLLIDPGAAGGEAGELVEEVLAEQPRNPAALWYGGFAAMARNEPEVLAQRWQLLLELSPPAAIRDVIEQQLMAMGAGGAATAAAATGANRITVTIDIDARLAGQVAAGAPLFLVARSETPGGPPIAAIRQPLNAWPVTLSISDDNVMLPGRSISDLERVKLVARVSNSGDAIAAPGDIYGELVVNSGSAEPVTLLIDQIVQ